MQTKNAPTLSHLVGGRKDRTRDGRGDIQATSQYGASDAWPKDQVRQGDVRRGLPKEKGLLGLPNAEDAAGAVERMYLRQQARERASEKASRVERRGGAKARADPLLCSTSMAPVVNHAPAKTSGRPNSPSVAFGKKTKVVVFRGGPTGDGDKENHSGRSSEVL